MKKQIIFIALTIVLNIASVCAQTIGSDVATTEHVKTTLLLPSQKVGQQELISTHIPLVEQDSILATIFTLDGNEIITQSELKRPSLQGEQRTLDDAIFETLVYLDAKKHKIEPNEDAVDRYLAKIMQENGINLQQMEEIFRHGGRTLKEGREELRKMQAVGEMVHFKIQSNLVVPRKDVEAYYHEHPEIKPARYHIRYVQVPFYKFMTKAEQQKDLIKKIRAEGVNFLGLSDPFWVTHGEVAQEKEFIYRLNPGKISKPFPTEDGFELYYLVEKEDERTVPLEERYRDIVNTLIQPKYAQLLAEYRKQLFNSASIIYHTK